MERAEQILINHLRDYPNEPQPTLAEIQDEISYDTDTLEETE